ncbi:AbiV family abortive infection protein [Intrasporangium sp. YIM S08009]|uniref:AbiV family abortive infection protein n=1 Tax=Intrasporangium zincisolvens TaxID=3080018 RepID=UPI002B062199|nr:AbiV family abortive infection protein [Intrasporangium sp. YIM S08009]
MDALLANADRLLSGAATLLASGEVALARSIGILGAEESGKAIAIFQRRVKMATEPEGAPFVTRDLLALWRDHNLKLAAVHKFLDDEAYWFGEGPWHERPDAEAIAVEIDSWRTDRNAAKQGGFYVDVSPSGDPVEPEEITDVEEVRLVLSAIHQIGWQLRLGEHIEAKAQMQRAQGTPAMSPEEASAFTETLRELLPADQLDEVVFTKEWLRDVEQSMAEGKPGTPRNNEAYCLHLPEHPFAHVGSKGYEAETRELVAVWNSSEPEDHEEEPDGARA